MERAPSQMKKMWKPRLCSIYRGSARRASVYATLQPTLLEIVVPCASPASQRKNFVTTVFNPSYRRAL
jgi:hypothetical protein